MRKRQFGKGKLVKAEDSNLAQDYMELNIKEAITDSYVAGTIRQGGEVSPHISLQHTVVIGTTIARTSTGDRILIGGSANINMKPSVDPGSGKEVYITSYAIYTYDTDEQDIDSDESIYYKDYQNSYTLSTIQGTIENIGLATKPTIPYDAILICDILYDTTLYASGLIQQSDIDTERQNRVSIIDLINSLGQPNGIATLDESGKITFSQLPNTIIGALQYKGTWDCSGGVYPILTSTGDYYICNIAGDISGTTYNIGDWLVYNGALWDKLEGSLETHASLHIHGGSDEIDGDKLSIDWNATYYTPTSTGVSDDIDHLSSHLNGIDELLGIIITSTGNLTSTQKIDLTDGGETNLHIHDNRYYTELESDSLFSSTGHTHTIDNSNTIRLVTSSGVAFLTDNMILCQGAFTLDLPDSSTCTGIELCIKNTSTGTVVVDAYSTELIDGAETYSLDSQYECIIIISDGTKWHIKSMIT